MYKSLYGHTFLFRLGRYLGVELQLQQLLLSMRNPFQDPQWMPETMDSIETYVDYVLFYTSIPMTRFNL